MSSEARTLSWSGSLSDPSPADAPEIPEPADNAEQDGETTELLDAVRAVRAGRGDMAEVMDRFRAATLYVEAVPTKQGQTVTTVPWEDVPWLPVFSSLQQLAAFVLASGRGEAGVDYGLLSGAELLEACLPSLPRGTGVVLDVAAEHVFALPPVAGIVPDSLALEIDEQEAAGGHAQ